MNLNTVGVTQTRSEDRMEMTNTICRRQVRGKKHCDIGLRTGDDDRVEG